MSAKHLDVAYNPKYKNKHYKMCVGDEKKAHEIMDG